VHESCNKVTLLWKLKNKLQYMSHVEGDTQLNCGPHDSMTEIKIQTRLAPSILRQIFEFPFLSVFHMIRLLENCFVIQMKFLTYFHYYALFLQSHIVNAVWLARSWFVDYLTTFFNSRTSFPLNYTLKLKLSYFCNRPWKPIEL
jgi:hypothetical protein